MKKPISFGDYIKRIGKSVGVLAAFGTAAPLVSLWPSDWAAFLFPPLGDLTPIAKSICIFAPIVVISCGYAAVDTLALKRWMIALPGVAFLVVMGFYFYYSEQYILKINTPDSFYLVSIGSDRTDFANRTFAKDESPWIMVKQRGLSDEDITKIWTRESVWSNRLRLFVTYFGMAVFWALVFSLLTAVEINSAVVKIR